jgi:hypothetical protein
MVLAIAALMGALLLGASTARADLDLTPTAGVYKLERMKIKHIVFHDGATLITYQPPQGWICTGYRPCAVLDIPDHLEARAFIESAPSLRVPAFDDKAEKLFQENPALLELPKGSKDIKITAIALNPLVIDSHPTLEVHVTYSFFGRECARSILLINRNGAEVSCVLDCLAPDFQPLHALFRASLYSFENL